MFLWKSDTILFMLIKLRQATFITDKSSQPEREFARLSNFPCHSLLLYFASVACLIGSGMAGRRLWQQQGGRRLVGWQLASDQHMLPCAKVNSEMPGMPPVSTVQPVPLGKQRLGINSAMYSLPAHYLHILQPSTLHTPSNTFSCIAMEIIVFLLRLPHLVSCPDGSHYSSNSFVPATVFDVACFALGFYSGLPSLIAYPHPQSSN